MIHPPKNTTRDNSRLSGIDSSLVIALTAVFALAATFVLAISSAKTGQKAIGFSVIVAVFLAICFFIYLRQSNRSISTIDNGVNDQSYHEGLGLLELEEAGRSLAGSIRLGDMFRFVCSRIKDVKPFQCCELLLLDETRSYLRVTESEGQESGSGVGHLVMLGDGIEGRSFANGTIGFDRKFSEHHGEARYTATVPLLHGEDVLGLFQIYFSSAQRPTDNDRSFFETLGAKVAPLILSSMAYERSLSNALTDGITDLPNERAFYLILENQVAESQRKQDERPLTVLAMDIKRFNELNRRFGHEAGDLVLNFASQVIKENLRQMDFLARSVDDEFLAVLPTASREILHEIIVRIGTSFFGRNIKLSDEGSIEVELNFGWSAYGTDGDTPQALLAAARLRKEQAKSEEPKRVLWFPAEMVN